MNDRDQGIVSSLIMFALVAMLVLALSGCSTVVPVAAKFPAAPGTIVSTPCPDLAKLKDNPALSDVSRTVTSNYTTYYECAVKVDAWIRWYNEQRVIFENAGKK